METASKELALILKEKGFDEPCFNYYTEYQVLDWIFNEISTRNDYFTKEDNLKWLQFWYTTLLKHKFSLMYEFIGRLEDWFESNGIILEVVKDILLRNIKNRKYHFHVYTSETECLFNGIFDTKQQAKHEAILKCFELLKQNKDDNS